MSETSEVLKELGMDINELVDIAIAKKKGRLIILPVPIGAPVYVTYKDTELDGTPMEGVDELHLAGFFKEGDREYYVTYDDGCFNDIEPDKLFTSREAAEKALAGGGQG